MSKPATDKAGDDALTVDVVYRGPDVPDRIVRGVTYPLVYEPHDGETDAVIIGPGTTAG